MPILFGPEVGCGVRSDFCQLTSQRQAVSWASAWKNREQVDHRRSAKTRSLRSDSWHAVFMEGHRFQYREMRFVFVKSCPSTQIEADHLSVQGVCSEHHFCIRLDAGGSIGITQWTWREMLRGAVVTSPANIVAAD